MSTRANIVLQDGFDKLYFYRHSDGYPDGALPTIHKFLDYIKEGKIRNNLGQAAGWLIVLGREEMKESDGKFPVPDESNPYRWKVGTIEPTTQIHGDVRYTYTVDVQRATVTYEEH